MALAGLGAFHAAWWELAVMGYLIGATGLFPFSTIFCYIKSKKHFHIHGKYPLYILVPLLSLLPVAIFILFVW